MSIGSFRFHRGVAAAILAVSVGAALAACGSGGGSSDSGGSAPAGEAAASTGAVEQIDACALIPADRITALLGTPIEGKPTGTDPEMPGCIWENPANYESVSLEIGNPDTAINGTLAPPEPGMPDPTRPGPDGMRFYAPGAVEFAADKRSNTVQVAVLSMLGEEADNAAVDLARQITAQLNG